MWYEKEFVLRDHMRRFGKGGGPSMKHLVLTCEINRIWNSRRSWLQGILRSHMKSFNPRALGDTIDFIERASERERGGGSYKHRRRRGRDYQWVCVCVCWKFHRRMRTLGSVSQRLGPSQWSYNHIYFIFLSFFHLSPRSTKVIIIGNLLLPVSAIYHHHRPIMVVVCVLW